MGLAGKVVQLSLQPVYQAVSALSAAVGLGCALPFLAASAFRLGLPQSTAIVNLWAVFSKVWRVCLYARTSITHSTPPQVPLGKRAFSFLVGIKAPYSATIGAQFIQVSPSLTSASITQR